MPTTDEVMSIHEAGHAVSDIFYGLTFKSVTLDDPIQGPRVCGEEYRKPADPLAPTAEEMDWIERQARATYAAQWAEKRAFGPDHVAGGLGDNEHVDKFARDYVPDPAARPTWMSRHYYAVEDDIDVLMSAIRAVADELVRRRTMTYDEVVSVYANPRRDGCAG